MHAIVYWRTESTAQDNFSQKKKHPNNSGLHHLTPFSPTEAKAREGAACCRVRTSSRGAPGGAPQPAREQKAARLRETPPAPRIGAGPPESFTRQPPPEVSGAPPTPHTPLPISGRPRPAPKPPRGHPAAGLPPLPAQQPCGVWRPGCARGRGQQPSGVPRDPSPTPKPLGLTEKGAARCSRPAVGASGVAPHLP